jgi:molecular chaperone GrpE
MTPHEKQESRGAPVPPDERHPAEAEEPVTSRDESGEPSGEESAANEREIEEATERSNAVEDASGEDASGEDASGEDASGEDASAADSSGGDASAADSSGDDPLAQAQRERDEYLDLARRTQADFENYRKRAAREAAAAGERAKSGLVRELLPIVDNLERALASAGEGEQHLAEGVRLVHSELLAVLERNGVEQFDPKGEQFDPAVHEALSMRSDAGADSGVVLDVVEKGYRTNGSVIRPARVVVSG